MKKFRVAIFECKSLKLISDHILFKDTIDEAREVGAIRYAKANQFSTAERIKE